MTVRTITNLSSNNDFGSITKYKATTSTGYTVTTASMSNSTKTMSVVWTLPEPMTLQGITAKFTAGSNNIYIYGDLWYKLKATDSNGVTTTLKTYSGVPNTKTLTSNTVIQNCVSVKAAIVLSGWYGQNIYQSIRNLGITVNVPDEPSDTDSDTDIDIDTDTDIVSDIDTDSDSDSDGDNDIDTDIDTNTDTDNDSDDDPPTPEPTWREMLDQIQWHDDKGHIFKDKLIEVFDMIEDKIKDLSLTDTTTITGIDPTNIRIENRSTTTDVVNDSIQIIDLQSFCSIMDIIGLPVKVTTDGNVGITSCAFVGDNYVLHTITPETAVTASTEKPFIHLDIDNEQIVALTAFDNNKPLLAVLVDNKLYTNNENIAGNVNFLKVLANQQPGDSIALTVGGNVQDATKNVNGQTVICIDTATNANSVGIRTTPLFLNEKLRDDVFEEKEIGGEE